MNGNKVAQYSLQKFTAIGITNWIQGITGYIHQPPQQQQTPQIQSTAYAQRLLHRDDHIVPFGYWSVFNEGAKVLIYVEQKLKLPIGEYDLIDGSMGKRWPSYRKDQPWCCPLSSYMHHYRDQRGSRECNAYDDAELKYFRSWLDEEYIPIHMPVYLKKKYSGYIVPPNK